MNKISTSILGLTTAFFVILGFSMPFYERAANAGEGTVVRQLALPAKDIIYDSATDRVYASLPSSVGSRGNSLIAVNPSTGETESPIFIGSEPGKMARSDNGQYLYVALDGAAAVRRFNLSTRTPELQFALGSLQSIGILSAADLTVMPGNPETVAVVRGDSGSTVEAAIYDNGVRRPTTSGFGSPVKLVRFGGSANRLYGGSGSDSFPAFRRMTVDAGGVTIQSTVSNSVFRDFQFAGGKVYDANGKIYDPEAGTQIGSFGDFSTQTFSYLTLDVAAGKAFYLTGNSAFPTLTLTLRVFDLNTFASLGTATISNVSGNPTRLIRCGGNGLAFLTGAGQIYFINSSLVSPTEPLPTPTVIPTPTVTPTPPAATSVRRVPLAINDLIYDQTRQTLLASIGSAAGLPNGNSVAQINPLTGGIVRSRNVGSEPAKLAAADDGQTLYIGLDGTNKIRRFNLNSFAPTAEFSIGNGDSDAQVTAYDIAVAPGQPNVVAVSRLHPGYFAPRSQGITIFDNGVARPNTIFSSNSSTSLEFGGDAATLYGSDTDRANGYYKMTVNDSGATNNFNLRLYLGNITFAGNRLYSTAGKVLDVNDATYTGTFGASGAVCVDLPNNRVYFITGSASYVLRAFDATTFLPVGTAQISGTGGAADSLVRWGNNGLAFRASGQLYIVQTSLVPSNETVPPSPATTVSPSPVTSALNVRQVALTTTDLASDELRQKIYATIPSSATDGRANTLTQIDPQTGIIGVSAPTAPSPGKLTVSDDNGFVYLAVNEASNPGVQRFNLASQSTDLRFSIGSSNFNGKFYVEDFQALPGQPNALAVSRKNITSSGRYEGVAVYDNGVQRPTIPNVNSYYANIFEFDGTSSTIYGANTQSSEYGLSQLTVNSSGVTEVPNSTVRGTVRSFGDSDMKFADNRLFLGNGRTFKPTTREVTGTFSVASNSLVAVDSRYRRAYFLSYSFGEAATLKVFDTETYLLTGQATISGLSGAPTSLIRWGNRGLAFRTANQIYLLDGAMIIGKPVPFDFDGDYKSDLAVFRPSNGAWYLNRSASGFSGVVFGDSSDKLVPADYDGDGKADVAVFRGGVWYYLRSSDGVFQSLQFGQTADVPVPADYDGDGRADVAVFRQGVWYILNSSTNQLQSIQFGSADDKAVPADYDGDGRTDTAVFRAGVWYVLKSRDGFSAVQFGAAGDKPVVGDYDGDGRADQAVYRNGIWYLLGSRTGFMTTQFGIASDIPVPADYDADGRTDVAVFRSGTWYLQQTTAGFAGISFGSADDQPVPAAIIP